MEIKEIKVSIRDLFQGYSDNDEGGVYALNGQLVCRPAYQREFVYDDKKRNAVIDSIRHELPLGVFYWSVCHDGEHKYEILDGQQRILSICQYLHKEFSIGYRGWANLTDDERKQIEDYELNVYICDGTDSERLAWFQRINIAGVPLTNQELLNATYTGPWLSDAKYHFSRRSCAAGQMADGYIKGNPIRQDYLEKVLGWIADANGMKSGQEYMAKHQFDDDADKLWQYFQKVIGWAKMLFPKPLKGITDCQEWGKLYNQYQNSSYNTKKLAEELNRLADDDEVRKNSGIIPYLLSDRTPADEKYLSIRVFSEKDKRKKYSEQEGVCPVCGKHFEYDEMEGDHIIPWHDGGKTEYDNLQMLCKHCNRTKSGK